MRKALLQILLSIEGLFAIILSDRDGVTILKVSLPTTPELALRMNFLSTFGNATDQAGKLGMGRNTKIISMYQKFQVIQISKLPVVITLIAKNNANTGFLLTLDGTLDRVVEEMKGVVRDGDNDD